MGPISRARWRHSCLIHSVGRVPRDGARQPVGFEGHGQWSIRRARGFEVTQGSRGGVLKSTNHNMGKVSAENAAIARATVASEMEALTMTPKATTTPYITRRRRQLRRRAFMTVDPSGMSTGCLRSARRADIVKGGVHAEQEVMR